MGLGCGKVWLVWPGPERRATGRVPPCGDSPLSGQQFAPPQLLGWGPEPGRSQGMGTGGRAGRRGTQTWFLDVLPVEAMDTQGPPKDFLGDRGLKQPSGTGEVGFQGGDEGCPGLGNSRDTDSAACPVLQPTPTQSGTGHPSPLPREGPAPPFPETSYGVRGGARLGVDAATSVLPWHRRGSHGRGLDSPLLTLWTPFPLEASVAPPQPPSGRPGETGKVTDALGPRRFGSVDRASACGLKHLIRF